MKKFALSTSPSNAKRRLLVTQLQKCFDQYSPHLRPLNVAIKLIEVGETLLSIDGFHEVADDLCFSK